MSFPVPQGVLWPSWLLVAIAALFEAYTAFIVKYRFNELGELNIKSIRSIFEYLIPFFSSPLLLLGVVTFGTAPVLWFIALNRLDLSVAYPVLVSLHLIFVLGFGLFFLEEALTTFKVLGIMCILAGLLFLTR